MLATKLFINKSTLGSLALVWQPLYEKENTKFKSALLLLKADFVPNPACGGRVG